MMNAAALRPCQKSPAFAAPLTALWSASSMSPQNTRERLGHTSISWDEGTRRRGMKFRGSIHFQSVQYARADPEA